jgi:hypothetical protein
MTAPITELSAQLDRLEQRYTAIAETPAQPRSTMAVIEYGLGNQQRAEVYINRLLRYLLDPESPHGMGTEFLTVFLESLPSSIGFDEDTYDLSDVRVDDQVPAQDGETQKYPDLVLDIPGEWLLVVELKFSAAETGTEFYATAPRIGDQRVDDYESGCYYLYLHQHDEPTASSDAFANWTWRSFVDDVLDRVITESAPRYPQRTTTQLHDLRDDLRTITSMTDDRTADEEKIELFIDHAEAIQAVTSAFDDAWDTYSEQWDRRLADHLATDESLSVTRRRDAEYPAVVVTRGDGEEERWILRATGGDWQHLHTDGWYKANGTFENLTTRASDNDDLRIGFYHRMGKHRDEAIRDHDLQFKFRNMGSNPGAFKDIYSDVFDARASEIETLLSGTKAQLTGNKLTKITATYDIPATAADDFFEAYTMALGTAFEELIIDRPELIEVLTETFDAALEEYADEG